MPKLSVYVADDVWEQLKLLAPGQGDSRLVQEAIQERIARKTARPYAVLDESLHEEQRKAKAFLAEHRTQMYKSGYRIGLLAVTSLNWETIEALAQCDWDFESWRTELFEATGGGASFDEWWGEEAELSVLSPWNVKPTGLIAEGFVDAIRSLWEGNDVSSPHAEASSPTDAVLTQATGSLTSTDESQA